MVTALQRHSLRTRLARPVEGARVPAMLCLTAAVGRGATGRTCRRTGPEASRRDLGHAFLGYDLDAKQRPAFRYVCHGVTITDAPVDVPPDTAAVGTVKAILRRVLTFASATDTTLHFRVARDPRIDDRGAGLVSTAV